AAVTIVAPEHAQAGYEPRMLFREVVYSGQDISELVGRPYTVLFDAPPSGPPREDILVGIVIGVEGDIDDAVSLALGTEGHFVEELAEAAWDGTSDNVEFRIPGMAFYCETPSSLSSIAYADPPPSAASPLSFTFSTGYAFPYGGAAAARYGGGLSFSGTVEWMPAETFSIGLDLGIWRAENTEWEIGDAAEREVTQSLEAVPLLVAGKWYWDLGARSKAFLQLGAGACFSTIQSVAHSEVDPWSEVLEESSQTSFCISGSAGLRIPFTPNLGIDI
ncbi:unnamed protein product, partial [marine sediment metagenome]